MNISDDLLCLYTETVDQQGDSYFIEIPSSEIQLGEVSEDGVYRVALIATPTDEADTPREPSERQQQPRGEPTPPVEEGDIREVEIEGLGDQGDGVGKINSGYVVIVPGTEPGDAVTVEMQVEKQNFAVGEVIRGRTGEGPESV